jgi:hypothetical protein
MLPRPAGMVAGLVLAAKLTAAAFDVFDFLWHGHCERSWIIAEETNRRSISTRTRAALAGRPFLVCSPPAGQQEGKTAGGPQQGR